MRISKSLLAMLCFLAPLSYSQTQTVVLPECTSNFALNGTTAISSASFSNAVPSCDKWTVTAYVVGFSAVNLTFQSAPAATTTTPGTFVTYIGTTATGTNPLTTQGVATFTNGTAATPFVRVTLSSHTGSGTVYGVIQGWNTGNSGSGGGGGGGCTAPCVVIGNAAAGSAPSGAPVLIGGSDGTNVRTIKTDSTGAIVTSGTSSTSCTLSAPITLSASGLTQIIALSSGKVITVCGISLGLATGVNVQLEYGTGSNCGTGTTAVTGLYQSITGIALDNQFSIPASQALCFNLSSAVAAGGFVTYAQN